MHRSLFIGIFALRHLFLIGYDISADSARRRALKLLKGHAVGGQKSLYECWLTTGELQQVMVGMRELIDQETDRVVFVRLDPRAAVLTRGVGVAPSDAEFFYQD
ncbi:MAG: CRISPR-associated endonuclease Cas2 [Woeseiaceae bacterium]|nr:CRISPR-associated endonuclease Cas2 [Woeseiaceae bacterium]